MGWPESDDSKYLWRDGGEPARQAYANVAKAISQFEPLYMAANPGEAAANARKVFADAPNVNVIEVPINDGWTRDWGPSVSPHLLYFCIICFRFICLTCNFSPPTVSTPLHLIVPDTVMAGSAKYSGCSPHAGMQSGMKACTCPMSFTSSAFNLYMANRNMAKNRTGLDLLPGTWRSSVLG
jgi:hypothetical protein